MTCHHQDVTPLWTLKPELQQPRSSGGRTRNKSQKIPRQDEPLDCYSVPTDHARSRAGRRFLIPTNPSRCGGDRLREYQTINYTHASNTHTHTHVESCVCNTIFYGCNASYRYLHRAAYPLFPFYFYFSCTRSDVYSVTVHKTLKH